MTYYFIIAKVKEEIFNLAGPFYSIQAAIVKLPVTIELAGKHDKRLRKGHFDIIEKENDTEKGVLNERIGI